MTPEQEIQLKAQLKKLKSEKAMAYPFIVQKHELVQCVTQVNVTRTFFPDTPNLRGVKIVGLCTYPVSVVAKTNLNNDVVNSTVFNKSFLTISYKNKEWLNAIPLQYLVPSNVNNFTLADFEDVDWQKSYVEIPNNSGLVADEAYLFSFYYEDRVPTPNY